MTRMAGAMDPADLTLIVRGLHRDVSDLDDRLRRLEAEIRILRDEAGLPTHPELRVLDMRPRG
jgi:hypothetical protein